MTYSNYKKVFKQLKIKEAELMELKELKNIAEQARIQIVNAEINKFVNEAVLMEVNNEIKKLNKKVEAEEKEKASLPGNQGKIYGIL